MPKGKIPYKAAGLHDPDKSLGYNWHIAAYGLFKAGKQKPHIASAMAYAEAMRELEIFGHIVSEERRLVREANIKKIGEVAAEHMLNAIRDGDVRVFEELADLAKYLGSERREQPIDPVRLKMVDYCLRKGYLDGWRPTVKEIENELSCDERLFDERQVRLMAKQLGIRFKGSPGT